MSYNVVEIEDEGKEKRDYNDAPIYIYMPSYAWNREEFMKLVL
jgi:hypothetical protein